MLKITVTRNDFTNKVVKVNGDYSLFEEISKRLNKAQNADKIKWYQVELSR